MLQIVLTLLFCLISQAIPAHPYLTEFLPDPASDWDGDGEVSTTGDEWVEICNPELTPINLSGYFLKDSLGDGVHIELSGQLSPGECAVFYGSDAISWQQENGVTANGLSLNNSGDRVELLYGEEVIDLVAYTTHVGEDDRSMAFFITEGEWILCDGLNLYGGSSEPQSTGCEPTPGELNSCEGLVPNDNISFGQVKQLFR
jgi:hypothetical protein